MIVCDLDIGQALFRFDLNQIPGMYFAILVSSEAEGFGGRRMEQFLNCSPARRTKSLAVMIVEEAVDAAFDDAP